MSFPEKGTSPATLLLWRRQRRSGGAGRRRATEGKPRWSGGRPRRRAQRRCLAFPEGRRRAGSATCRRRRRRRLPAPAAAAASGGGSLASLCRRRMARLTPGFYLRCSLLEGAGNHGTRGAGGKVSSVTRPGPPFCCDACAAHRWASLSCGRATTVAAEPATRARAPFAFPAGRGRPSPQCGWQRPQRRCQEPQAPQVRRGPATGGDRPPASPAPKPPRGSGVQSRCSPVGEGPRKNCGSTYVAFRTVEAAVR